jgi:vWA-MoxR associated protein C-terminal domain/Trypsin-like peptidase domain
VLVLGDAAYPVDSSWIASIHGQENLRPVGSGIVLDERRVLTCYHVIEGLAEKWVGFPRSAKGASLTLRKVESVVLPEPFTSVKDPLLGYIQDLAILVLAEPVPVGVNAAPLYFPEPVGLVGKRWWAFGFPGNDPVGSSSGGWFGDVRAHGWTRLLRDSPDPVEGGFSGGGLWCPDHQAVAAVVAQSDGKPGGGRAITLHQANQCFPGENLSALAMRHPLPAAFSVAPLAPEVVELAGQVAGRGDALEIIHEVFDRALAVAPPGASIPVLLTRLHDLVPPRGAAPWLRQVRELAEKQASDTAQAAAAPAVAGDAAADGGVSLLVAIREDDYDRKTMRLSMTLFVGGQPGQPLDCDNPAGSLKDMKERLRVLLPAILGARRGLPLVEFAVPHALLGEDFDQWPMLSRPGGARAEDYRLGERYPVVVRDVDRMNPRGVLAGDRDPWESRWNALLDCEGLAEDVLRETDLHRETLGALRAALWDTPAAGTAVLVLLPAPGPASGKPDRVKRAVRELIKAGAAAGVPAVVWLRPPPPRKADAASTGADGDEDDRTYLSNALRRADVSLPARARDLPLRVRSLRQRAEAAQRGKFHPGRRLSLLWEDPNRSWTPPDLQLPSRSANGDDL